MNLRKKNSIILFVVLVISCLSSGCATTENSDHNSEPDQVSIATSFEPAVSLTPTSTHTPLPSYTIEQEMFFHSPSSLEKLDVLRVRNGEPESPNREYFTEKSTLINDEGLHIGFLSGDENLRLVLPGSPVMGQGVFLRYRFEGTPGLKVTLINENNTRIGFTMNAYGNPQLTISGNPLVMTHEEQGVMFMVPGNWISHFAWTETQQVFNHTQIVFYSLIWDENNPARYLLERAILQDIHLTHKPQLQITGDVMEEGEVIHFDRILVISGNPIEYLKENSTCYQNYAESMLEFFTNLPLRTEE